MSVLATVFRASERIGFVSTVACAIAWLVCGALLARAAAAASLLWRIPMLGLAVEILLCSVVGIGGLLSFWLIANHIDYLRRGYRVKWTCGNDWLYEERISATEERFLPCVRVIVGKGYPAPSEVRILSEASWDSEAPLWARGRRGEITQRIAQCFGGDRGASIRFLDA